MARRVASSRSLEQSCGRELLGREIVSGFRGTLASWTPAEQWQAPLECFMHFRGLSVPPVLICGITGRQDLVLLLSEPSSPPHHHFYTINRYIPTLES